MCFTAMLAPSDLDWGGISKNAFWNKFVLSNALNLSKLLVHLMLVGKLFHSLGATYLKDLAANVVCLAVGMLSKTPMLLDLMFAQICALT